MCLWVSWKKCCHYFNTRYLLFKFSCSLKEKHKHSKYKKWTFWQNWFSRHHQQGRTAVLTLLMMTAESLQTKGLVIRITVDILFLLKLFLSLILFFYFLFHTKHAESFFCLRDWHDTARVIYTQYEHNKHSYSDAAEWFPPLFDRWVYRNVRCL